MEASLRLPAAWASLLSSHLVLRLAQVPLTQGRLRRSFADSLESSLESSTGICPAAVLWCVLDEPT